MIHQTKQNLVYIDLVLYLDCVTQVKFSLICFCPILIMLESHSELQFTVHLQLFV